MAAGWFPLTAAWHTETVGDAAANDFSHSRRVLWFGLAGLSTVMLAFIPAINLSINILYNPVDWFDS